VELTRTYNLLGISFLSSRSKAMWRSYSKVCLKAGGTFYCETKRTMVILKESCSLYRQAAEQGVFGNKQLFHMTSSLFVEQ
jgi:hypothetical protein